MTPASRSSFSRSSFPTSTVDRLLRAIREAADHGIGVLLIEQHVEKALSVADRAYILRHGEIGLSGTADDLRGRIDEILNSSLSILTSDVGRPRFGMAEPRTEGMGDRDG